MRMVLKAILAILAAMTIVVTIEAIIDQEVEVRLIKRVNGRGKQSISADHEHQVAQSDKPPSHLSNQNKFDRSLRRNLERGSLRGVLHTEVRADPRSKHQYPTTAVQEGRKGGKVVSTFMSQHSIQGNEPLYIRVGEYGKFRGSALVPHPPNVAGFSDPRSMGVIDGFERNLAIANQNKFEYKATSSHTVTDAPHSKHERPLVRVYPGKESGHIMSLYIRPNSPDRSRSPDLARSHGAANLIGTSSSNHQGQQSGKKRGRDQRSISPSGRQRSPPLDPNLKLGLK